MCYASARLFEAHTLMADSRHNSEDGTALDSMSRRSPEATEHIYPAMLVKAETPAIWAHV